ncbi:kinase-like domain-containing protein, partial [Apodospora peruviana]
RRRLMQDLNLMKSCVSPHIVSIIGALEPEWENSSVTILTEYMEGRSTQDIVIGIGPFDHKVLGKVAEAVLRAIDYLHTKHRIIHRDVRPGNIFLNARGEIKLGGFDLATTTLRTFHSTLGPLSTAPYMSPERTTGQHYTVTCDVWSLGISLIELGTGKSWTYGKGLLDVLDLIVRRAPPTLPEGYVGPESLHVFIERCLEKDPRRRASPARFLVSDRYFQTQRGLAN